jgi:putative heme-binding domain-containing protein
VGGGGAGGYFTGATGTTIYRGHAWPAEYRGQSFTGDVGSNIVHRKTLEANGVGLIARRADEKKEFVASTDNWFRPAQFANAPDGALYIIDVYREVIEHPLSLPPEIKQHLDLTSGRDRGRIYRIVPDGFSQPALPRLSEASTAELVALLEHPNGWHRDTAARLLYQRQDAAAVDALEALSAQSQRPQGRMHAMYALAGINALTPKVLAVRLADDDARVREHAVRLSERLAAASPELPGKLCALAADPDPRVRYQLAFTLGEISDPGRTAALATIARRDAGDRWVRLAVFSSLATGAGDVFARLAEDSAWRATADGRALLGELARYIGRQNRREELSGLLTALDALPAGEMELAAAVVRGLGEGLAKGPGTLAAQLAALDGEKAGRVLNEMLSEAARRAALDDQRPAARVDAIRLLALGSFDQAGPILTGLVSNQQPHAVQSAAINALAKFADPAVAATIIGAWPGFSPRLRGEAAEAIFSRGEWLAAFLQAAASGRVSLADLDPARLKLLEQHADPAVRAAAAPLLSKIKLGRRQDVVDTYRPAIAAQGDRSRGREIFQKTCAACHRLEGVGHEIGPNLASFRNRGAEALLVNILDPNREANPQYVNYVLITRDGRSMTGIVAAETATSVTLRRGEDATDTVAREDIEELRASGLSIMPEGLEKEIDQRAMADLLAYLLQAL